MLLNGLDSQLSLLSSETPTASESSQSDGRECRSSRTCGGLWATPTATYAGGTPERFLERKREWIARGAKMGLSLSDLQMQVGVRSGSSPLGSLVNLIPLQESVRRLVTSAISGRRLPVSFGRFVRDGSSGRMFPVSCTPNLDGSLVEFSGTWPTWGIALDGVCGELPTLERCTAGSASSSWPTPAASDVKGSVTGECLGQRMTHPRGVRLPEEVLRRQFYPTPGCPRPHDSENTVGKFMPGQKQYDLTTAVASNGGQLNPTWVEWLMGFPLGWTALEPSGTQSFHNKPTRSSRKSRGPKK